MSGKWVTLHFMWLAGLLFFIAGLSAQEKPADPALLPGLPSGGILDQLGGPGSSGGDHVTMTGEYKMSKGGRDGRLFVRAELEPGWHTYSMTLKPGAPATPSEIEVANSKQYTFSRPFVADRAPVIEQLEGFPVVEEFEVQVVWSAPFRITDGVDPERLTFDVTFRGQVCATECIQIQKQVPVKFAGYVDPAAVGEFQPKGLHTLVRGEVAPRTIAPGGMVKVAITALPAADYHVYPYAERDPGKGSKPTIIAFKNDAGWKKTPVKASEKPVEHQTGLPEEPIQLVHEKPITWTLELQVPEDAPQGGYEIRGLVGLQTCSNNGCDIPKAAEFSAVVEVSKRNSDPSSEPFTWVDGSYSGAAKLAAAVSSANDAAPAPASNGSNQSVPSVSANSASANSAAANATAADQPVNQSPGPTIDLRNLTPQGGTDVNQSMLVVLPTALLAGFILNFMPCVLPVIGLKIVSFVNQAGESRSRIFMLNVWYCVGIIAVFMVLATMAVFAGLSWGEQFQSSTFNIALASIVFAFALSFLGIWEIPLPGFVGSKSANQYAEQEGPVGAIFKGGLTTVLATPCSGPLLVPALAWAVSQPPVITYIAFACVGLGMAFPYLLVGAFPRLISFLPKPGAWMETFKHMMGFVLLGTVVFILTYVQITLVVPTVAFMVGLWAALWWIGRVPVWDALGKRVRAWAGGIAFATLIGLISFTPFVKVVCMKLGAESPWFTSIHESMESRFASEVDNAISVRMSKTGMVKTATPTSEGTELPWQPYSHDLLAQLLSDKKTVFIDFTADWCLNCKLNERNALNVAETKAFIEANSISTLKADQTHDAPEVKEMLRRLGGSAIPYYAVFPASRPDKPIVFSGLVTKNKVIGTLQEALSADSAATTSSKPASASIKR